MLALETNFIESIQPIESSQRLMHTSKLASLIHMESPMFPKKTTGGIVNLSPTKRKKKLDAAKTAK